ncbi:uncharacterized protein LOC131842445 [Achroia grisella]|uniref:uncharacterized protein LOC131842445 n=1 Tax=Achroia grisella TaxID=688607 RepID=UPI0027D330C2|nr:uncharacterized protein LOC131842445 [Achroia grisella]
MDIEGLRSDAVETDWSPVMSADSIDDKVMQFNIIVTKLYDVHAPLRAIKIKHTPAPWLTDEIRALMHKKVTTKAKFKRRPTNDNKMKYYQARNRCNRMCRDAQRHYIHNSISDQESAKVWKFLRSLGVGKIRHKNLHQNLDMNSLNQHFSSSSIIMDIDDKTSTISYLSSLPTPNYSPFVFNQFTECDVKKSIMAISSSAVGVDCISRNMILPILDQILSIICHILNHSVITSVYPKIWKEAQIIPRPKKANPASRSDFRPICILPFLSKVLERLIHNQFTSFLNKKNLINPLQSGFRPGHSITTALKVS